ncbi:Arylsulfatase [Gimesia alba]|uniref:Arylsulfatase n=1 Tax=Gimesia alba TaxID=2527973 RepID=A0A517RJ65_9PLAN|nr:sulfatase [Gimesia alba]QDT43917.1 Arylsulfatase [Gimesia alba]
MQSLKWCSLLLSLCLFPNMLQAAGQPNIIILLADDLGYGELGCQGNPQIPTPHIDSIAADGIRFTQAYVTAPNCSPSRAGLLTGKIPTRFGYEFNPIGARNEDPGTGLPPAEQTLAELLHDQGYTTGLIGKWHLGGAADYHPYRHGFDEFFGFVHEGHYFVPPPYQGVTTMLRRKTIPGGGKGRWMSDNLIYSSHMGHDEPDYDANNPIIRGGQPVEETAYLTDAFTREAVSFIDRHQDKPFFLYLAYNAVHSPLQGKQEDMQRFKDIEDVHRRIFAAMLASLDDSVGKILNQVHKSKLDQKTLIIFLSDNGGPTRELTSSNLPLRGGKGSMYEGGLRIPFMMRWTGTLKPKQTFSHPISSMDIFSTSALLAGAEAPANLDGRDLMPYLLKQKTGAPHEELFWRQGNRAALRKGDWKIVNHRRHRKEPVWELFNIAEDLSEEQNLASQQAEKLNELKARWKELNAQMKPAIFQ